MRSKVTVVLLFLNVVLFAYIYFYHMPTIAGTRAQEARRRVLPTEIASMDSLTRTEPGGEVVKIERRNDAWWITQPFDWPASPDAVTHLHNELQFLEHETSFPVADLAKSGQTLADYGLAKPALTLDFTAAGKSYRLLVGDNTKSGNRLYLLSPDGSRIHVVNRSLLDSIGLPLTDLRNSSIFSIPVFEVRSLNIQTAAPANLKVRLRRDATGRWGFESPILARAAKVAVEVTINALNGLTAKSFVDTPNADLDRTGLNSPLLRVTLEGNARRETLLIGGPAATTGDYYAKMEDKAVVFTTAIHPKLVEILRSAQESLRDRRVADFDPATVTSLTLSAPGQPELALQRLEQATPVPAATNESATTPAAPAAVDGWLVVTRLPGQAPITVPGDPQVINELLQKLQLLSAIETTVPDQPAKYGFLSDAPSAAELERYGFNAPEREFTLSLTTGGGLNGDEPSTVVLQVGVGSADAERGRVFARLANPPFVYEIRPDILDQAPVSARHYLQRQLRDLPEGALVTRLNLIDLSTNASLYGRELKEGERSWDPIVAAEPEANRAALQGLLAGLRKLRAQSFVADNFNPDHADTPAGPRPWRYRLDYTVAFAGGDSAGTPSSLLLTERLGGTSLIAGTADFGGVVFTVSQELVDAVFRLTYGTANDPGPRPPEPAAAPTPPPAVDPAPVAVPPTNP
jgi:hypothetical protein